jgi:sugar lactone lactonase YvrE
MRILGSIFALLLAAGSVAAQDMPLSQVILPKESWRPVEASLRTVHGLTADKEGNVYVSDPAGKQILRIDKDGKAAVFTEASSAVHGLCFDPNGRLLGCQPEKKRIVALEAKGKETTVAEVVDAFDLVVTRTGTMYCSTGREIVVLGPDGKRLSAQGAADSVGGLTLWADQGTLVASDPMGKTLYAYRIEKDGSLAHKEPYYAPRFRKGQTSQASGMALDSAGRVYAATGEGVQVFDTTGRLSGVLTRPDAEPVKAVVFGGASLDQLYVACGNKIYVRKMQAKGVRPAEKKEP